jgi:hypothetical protein
MKPSVECSTTLENRAIPAVLAGRCTSRCTETAGRADELARVVALVAQLPGTDDERAGLLKKAVELLGSLHPRE